MIQVYTGNGKGKTTASVGLAVRAAGAGLRVYIGQFIKGKICSEHYALKKIKNITVEQFGCGCFIAKINKRDVKLAECGLAAVKKAIADESYDVIIMDEIGIALKLKLLDCKDLIKLIKNLSSKQELILTGRDIPFEIVKLADLVSEIKEIKHYFHKGVKARIGIEY